ncbi:hypothetical protein HJC23_007320 [Cyclotella cryptica]|uniref:Uncharacterized protein n=1 Tax=Cyclotella cryptica TaxID=29204 RepID=A0ABD3NXA0_9STRA|eukprot:CCRYP_019289-RA/>CCRYP_019289-RA protein AED:0.40 eAED:0.40 QI:0/-1/0/1/-1/1/1/0/592
MAFDRPIEADRVEDLGLFASFLRAPVVGTILWLLGGEDAKKAEEEERRGKQERKSQEDEQHGEESFRDYELKKGRDGNDVVDRGKRGGYNCPTTEEDASSPMLEPWPQISSGVDSDEDDLSNNSPHYEKFVTGQLSTPRPSSNVLRQNSSGPASRVVDELVAVMDASSLDDKSGNMKRSPNRTSSRSDLACLDSGSTDSTEMQSAPASFSSNQKPLSSKESTQSLSSINNRANQFNSNIRVKKMSWSDETGERSLVEYFDERIHQCRYKRGTSWKPSRSISFDSQDKTLSPQLSRGGRSKVRVIKSALKRSGSYSPPNQMYAAKSQSTESVCETTSSQHSSTSGMKSFRSISVVGSVSSDSTCTELSSGERRQQHAHLSVQEGCGRASGGLMFPTGGPNGFPAYQLTLGTAAGPSINAESTSAEEEEAKLCSAPDSEGVTATPAASTTTWIHPNSNRHSKPHHFLPHHSNGYISPQYGFYVNITPPTPEMFYPRPPPGPPSHDKRSPTVQQQSYQQFQRQQPYRPSPIPEVATVSSHYNDKKAPCQPVFQDSSMDGSKRRERPLKPGFNKNMKMGMFLSENPHQVWPTVPFG